MTFPYIGILLPLKYLRYMHTSRSGFSYASTVFSFVQSRLDFKVSFAIWKYPLKKAFTDFQFHLFIYSFFSTLFRYIFSVFIINWKQYFSHSGNNDNQAFSFQFCFDCKVFICVAPFYFIPFSCYGNQFARGHSKTGCLSCLETIWIKISFLS